jgi:hypothetical protein
MIFVQLSRHGASRRVAVNPAAIAFLDACEGGANVHFASADPLRVSETPAQILAAIGKAEAAAAARQDSNLKVGS